MRDSTSFIRVAAFVPGIAQMTWLLLCEAEPSGL